MNQDRDKNAQNQGKQHQTGQGQNQGQNEGQGKPQMNERGNPSTTERIQPEPNRGGRKPEGEKPTGSQQPKF